MNTLILRPAESGNYDWLLCGPGNERLRGPGRDPPAALRAQLRSGRSGERQRVVLLAPAEDVQLRELGFQARERRHILSTVPFAFEDQLIEDSDTLHFATDRPAADRVHVAIVRERRMREWLEPLNACGLPVAWVAPEQCALALDEGRWQGWYDGDRLVVRTGEHSGVAARGDVVELTLRLLLDGENAETLRVATAEPAQFQRLVERTPERLRDRLEPGGEGPMRAAAAALQQAAGRGINLLQGRFALALPWREWLARWKWPLAPLAAAAALQFAVLALDRAALHRENLSLRRATQAVYEAMFPGSPMPSDLRGYLSSRLSADGGAERAGTLFTGLMSRIGQAASRLPELQFTNLNYDGNSGEMRIDITVPDFSSVTALREHLRNNRIDAKLLNSNAQRGGGVRVQLLCANA